MTSSYAFPNTIRFNGMVTVTPGSKYAKNYQSINNTNQGGCNMENSPHYWPSVSGIKRSIVISHYKWPVMRSFCVFFIVYGNKLLKIYGWCRWFETQRRSFEIIVMESAVPNTLSFSDITTVSPYCKYAENDKSEIPLYSLEVWCLARNWTEKAAK